jgi:plasmid stabilization system protein ParE
LRIVWTDDVVANLEAIFTYVSAFNPSAAGALADR